MAEKRICPVCESVIPAHTKFICPKCYFNLSQMEDEKAIDREKQKREILMLQLTETKQQQGTRESKYYRAGVVLLTIFFCLLLLGIFGYIYLLSYF